MAIVVCVTLLCLRPQGPSAIGAKVPHLALSVGDRTCLRWGLGQIRSESARSAVGLQQRQSAFSTGDYTSLDPAGKALAERRAADVARLPLMHAHVSKVARHVRSGSHARRKRVARARAS